MEILKKYEPSLMYQQVCFFLIDTSGSMQETKIDIAKKAIRKLSDCQKEKN